MVLSGHEHNFQHSRAAGIEYFVTGGGGKIRQGAPTRFAEAHTVKWASAVHFLRVKIDGTRAEVVPIGDDGAPLATMDPSGGTTAPETVVKAPE
jgi:tartrate-resistant acid phosphatase type 5